MDQNGPGGAGYAHAERGVARSVHDLALQLQLAPHSIRVTAVHPTNVSTNMLMSDPMDDVFRSDLEHPTQEDAEVAFPAVQPMPFGCVEPVDTSDAVLHLASDEARCVTGLQLEVDGGALLATTTSGAPG